jgi:hypothetical protein
VVDAYVEHARRRRQYGTVQETCFTVLSEVDSVHSRGSLPPHGWKVFLINLQGVGVALRVDKCYSTVQPFTLLEFAIHLGVYGKVCPGPSSILNRPHFISRRQPIHASQVRKKVVVATMESSRSHRVARSVCIYKCSSLPR